MNVGVALPIGGDSFGHDRMCHRAFEGYGEASSLTLRHRANGFQGPPCLLEQTGRLVLHGGTGFGQVDPAPGPFEQKRAELIFQCDDGTADRRLRHVEALGCGPKAKILRDRQKVTKLPEFHNPCSLGIREYLLVIDWVSKET